MPDPFLPPPVIVPPPALLKWELGGYGANIPIETPPFKPTVIDILGAEDARQAAFEAGLGLGPGGTPTVAVENPVDVNGGPAAWGGMRIGTPTTQQLPMTPRRDAVTKLARGLSAVWRGGKWVALKADKFVLGPVGNVMTAYEIYQWARDYAPNDRPLPAQIPTRFQLWQNRLLYEHPGGYWLESPPPGYDATGKYMWGKK